LKLLAGGVVAAVGGTIAGGAASAKPGGFYYQQYNWVCEPEVNPVINVGEVNNQVIENGEDCHLEVSYGRATPWWSAFYPGRQPAGFGVNGSYPF
jgi:hypothetical protein